VIVSSFFDLSASSSFFQAINTVLSTAIDTLPHYRNLVKVLVQISTSSDISHHAMRLLWKGHCDYYARFNPQLKHHIEMDETDEEKLELMMYDAQAYALDDAEKLRDALLAGRQ
jgi:hypothetical protein